MTSIELVKRAKKLTATSILMLGLIAAIVFFVAPVLKTTFLRVKRSFIVAIIDLKSFPPIIVNNYYFIR